MNVVRYIEVHVWSAEVFLDYIFKLFQSRFRAWCALRLRRNVHDNYRGCFFLFP